jgi:hypothetical protein
MGSNSFKLSGNNKSNKALSPLLDLISLKIDIDNATIYSDDVVTSDQDWQQKFAIVGGESFVIPSLKLDYFDKKTQTINLFD